MIRSDRFGLAFLGGLLGVAIFQSALLAQKADDAKANATVSLLSGSPAIGAIVSADAGKVILETKAGPSELKSVDIARITFPNKLAPQPGPVELTLLDGSKAFGDRLIGKGSSGWRLRVSPDKAIPEVEVTVIAKTLKAARLKAIGPELISAWQIAIQETKNTDAVIVLRPGNNLDRINGVIVQVQEASVTFDLDGQQIDIPIEKLIGLVWFQRDLERVKPTIEVVATNQSVWMAESFSFDAKSNALELRTQLGQTVSIPKAEIASINYATANIRWLSELETLESVAEMQIEFRSPIAALGHAFLPRFAVNGSSPSPSAQPGDKDLCFPSPGHYLFRAPQGFSSLQCRVERTGNGSQRTDLLLEVWQDDQKVSEYPLAYNVDYVDLDVSLKPEKKTKLAVVCNSKLLIGTEVTWKQPRLKR